MHSGICTRKRDPQSDRTPSPVRNGYISAPLARRRLERLEDGDDGEEDVLNRRREQENEEGGKQGEVSLFQKPDAGYDSRCEYKKHFILRGLLFINPLSPRDQEVYQNMLGAGRPREEGPYGYRPLHQKSQRPNLQKVSHNQ